MQCAYYYHYCTTLITTRWFVRGCYQILPVSILNEQPPTSTPNAQLLLHGPHRKHTVGYTVYLPLFPPRHKQERAENNTSITTADQDNCAAPQIIMTSAYSVCKDATEEQTWPMLGTPGENLRPHIPYQRTRRTRDIV